MWEQAQIKLKLMLSKSKTQEQMLERILSLCEQNKNLLFLLHKKVEENNYHSFDKNDKEIAEFFKDPLLGQDEEGILYDIKPEWD